MPCRRKPAATRPTPPRRRCRGAGARARSRCLDGGTLARTGDDLAGPALLLARFALTGSPATGALLLAALTVPAVLGGPLVGVLLDRAPRPGRLLAAALLA
ncbi:hypothetical protein OIM90_04600 [Streptomyces sp. AD16]|uniref:hypothetical protein n=1 Tax=Streptomyces TaxID=1883 RepID=UPI0013E2A4C2|nr:MULTISPECIES: hypothetical protein [Streptomyces]WDV34618.1 hypothetical protein OIM90_04600 [Streptomyces sp. AD16]